MYLCTVDLSKYDSISHWSLIVKWSIIENFKLILILLQNQNSFNSINFSLNLKSTFRKHEVNFQRNDQTRSCTWHEQVEYSSQYGSENTNLSYSSHKWVGNCVTQVSVSETAECKHFSSEYYSGTSSSYRTVTNWTIQLVYTDSYRFFFCIMAAAATKCS